MMDSERLMQGLSGVSIRYYEAVDSSNDVAKDWLREGAVALSTVVANEQRQGRGRLGRVWYTPPDVAVAMSVVLKPTVETASRIGIMGALAVAESCAAMGADDVGIKWANDVQIGGKKVCGVLPEAVWDGQRLVGVVLGIGVNLRNDLSPELQAIATTLEAATGEAVDTGGFIQMILRRIMWWSPRLHQQEFYRAWKARLNMLDQVVQVGDVRGLAVDVEESGALVLDIDGERRSIFAGDIHLIERDDDA